MAQDRLDSTGLTYLWGKLKSLFASQSVIGDTPMGTTATTVTGAIAEHEGDINDLNINLTNITLGSSVNIHSYNENNKYTTTKDGYLVVSCAYNAGAFNQVYIEFASGNQLPVNLAAPLSVDTVGRLETTVFVRKGCKLFAQNKSNHSGNNAYFYPLV